MGWPAGFGLQVTPPKLWTQRLGLERVDQLTAGGEEGERVLGPLPHLLPWCPRVVTYVSSYRGRRQDVPVIDQPHSHLVVHTHP